MCACVHKCVHVHACVYACVRVCERERDKMPSVCLIVSCWLMFTEQWCKIFVSASPEGVQYSCHGFTFTILTSYIQCDIVFLKKKCSELVGKLD